MKRLKRLHWIDMKDTCAVCGDWYSTTSEAGGYYISESEIEKLEIVADMHPKPKEFEEKYRNHLYGWFMDHCKKQNLETSVIYCADNLDVMITLPSESIDMIYIDPPFFSNRVYETIWKDKEDTTAFNDRWKGGVYHFVEWMRPRLEQIHRLLKPTGTFFCHMDWHANHYIKVVLDEIFGYRNFRNQIIWRRGTPRGNAGKKFAELTDHILLYSKSSKYTWHPQYGTYRKEYIEKYYNQIDEKTGKRFQPTSLLGHRGVNPIKKWRGLSKPWRYPIKELEKLDQRGKIYWPPKGSIPRLKRFLNDQKGMPIGNIWDDIFPVNSQADEQVGYPTQKPLALLERIIKTSTNKRDIVADFFCGCGTTLVSASQCERRYIGVDNSPKASKVIRKRLKALKIEHYVMNVAKRIIHET